LQNDSDFIRRQQQANIFSREIERIHSKIEQISRNSTITFLKVDFYDVDSEMIEKIITYLKDDNGFKVLSEPRCNCVKKPNGIIVCTCNRNIITISW